MNNTDKICKEVLDLFVFVKEQAVKSLVSEITNEKIILTAEDLERTVNVLNSTLETSFQRGFTNFQKQLVRLNTEFVENSKNRK